MTPGELVGIRRDELLALAEKAFVASTAFASKNLTAYQVFLDLAHQCRVAELVLAAIGEPAAVTIRGEIA